MSELLFGYLANSILRGAVVVGLLWLIELCCRRRLIFAGGRWLYLAALLLILLPFEQLATLRASTPLPVRHVELPVWSVALPPPEPEEAAPAAEAPDVRHFPPPGVSPVSQMEFAGCPAVSVPVPAICFSAPAFSISSAA